MIISLYELDFGGFAPELERKFVAIWKNILFFCSNNFPFNNSISIQFNSIIEEKEKKLIEWLIDLLWFDGFEQK